MLFRSLELKQAIDSAGAQDSSETISSIMRKYDIIFGLNGVSSKELYISLRDHFHIDVDYEDLLKILPSICNSLGFQIEKLVKPSNGYRTDSDFDYFITLK